jgi:HD-GYP domain-containing protein (c-di-GMP phosphodiesterase class II)
VIPVLVKELENLKYIPYDIFTKSGRLIFKSGEVLTPGKLLKLRYLEIYKLPEAEVLPVEEKPPLPEAKKQKEFKKSVSVKTKSSESILPILAPDQMIVSNERRLNEINPEAIIKPEVQITIKSSMHKVFDAVTQGQVPDPVIYTAAQDKIVTEVLNTVDQVSHLNQLRVFDDYDYSHGVNVAILSVMVGAKLHIGSSILKTLALGALLHDIGKTRIPKQILYKPGPLSDKEYEIVKLHSPIGYKIIKDEMGLSEDIAKPALEHQEKFDGTGYPRGISGESIGMLSQIVSVCDVYDALVSTRVYSNPKPSQDALKIMLSYGSKWFNPTILYKFTHMTSFTEERGR